MKQKTKGTSDSTGKRTISFVLRRNLAIIVALAFLASTSVVYILNTVINNRNYEQIINTTLVDIDLDIKETNDINMLSETYRIKGKIEPKLDKLSKDQSDYDMDAYLKRIAKYDGLSEVNVVDKNNIITYSNIDEFVGFDMNANSDTKEFNKLNHGEKEVVQPVRANAYSGKGKYANFNKYAGVSLKHGGYLQVAISAHQFQKQIDEKVAYIAANRHIGQTGYTVIADSKDDIISNADGKINVKLSEIGIDIDKEERSKKNDEKKQKAYTAEINGVKSMYMYRFVEGYYIIGLVPTAEVQAVRDRAAMMNSVIEILVFAMMFLFISLQIKKLVVSRLRNVNNSLHKIIRGELDTTIEEYSTKEFVLLSEDINMTVKTLKEYTEKEKERIKNELEYAKTIQEGTLPKLSSLNTAGCEFDLYATMDTAKEVGGDFYDFYMLKDNKLAILVADVSGKGIPAAMFMMTCKTMLKNLVETSDNLGEMFTKANSELVESNDANMFVTVWMGILDLETGHIEYVNAGHNPPLVYNEKGEFEYMQCKPGFVLTGMPGLKYKTQEYNLKPGDRLYLYTDGATEAINTDLEMYGEDRLLEVINEKKDILLKDMLLEIKEDIDEFTGEAEQFDDITMLGLIYRGKQDQ